MKILITYLVIINIVGFIIMYIDKKRALNNQYRIPEKTLFTICIIGGSLGILMGMYKFRHKTKHNKFVFGVPTLLIMNIIVILNVNKLF